MRNQDLAKDYIRRAAGRLRALDVLYEDGHWADVVREAQEVVELALKAGLRAHGVDPPRLHDVSDVLLAERDRLPAALTADLDELVRIRANSGGIESSPSTEPKISRRRASTRRPMPRGRATAPASPSDPSSRTCSASKAATNR